ncbi:unnamed protein product, partial [Discosporangium mesarthrocarpum]
SALNRCSEAGCSLDCKIGPSGPAALLVGEHRTIIITSKLCLFHHAHGEWSFISPENTKDLTFTCFFSSFQFGYPMTVGSATPLLWTIGLKKNVIAERGNNWMHALLCARAPRYDLTSGP